MARYYPNQERYNQAVLSGLVKKFDIIRTTQNTIMYVKCFSCNDSRVDIPVLGILTTEVKVSWWEAYGKAR